MCYAAAVSAGLFFILRVERASVGTPMFNPDTSTRTGYKFQCRQGSTYIYLIYEDLHDAFHALASYTGRIIAPFEGYFSGTGTMAALFIGTLDTFLHGWQYSRWLLHALTSHFICILVVSTLGRLRVPVIALFPWLNSTLWIWYYFLADADLLPAVYLINQNIFRIFPPSHFMQNLASWKLRPVIIYASALCLWTILIALLGIPSVAST
ncbi:hypothetical protein C8R43DRAFT_1122688 [Mycena crocata]|nr:hypothetical protein C8R43DRAFT_1122688 [Mycena crocata]